VTIDGGLKWTDVTPPQIKPWTRIFNMDAGHFDTLTAYAAANTLRVDDFNPHFWRTHDGGKTWTEINTASRPAPWRIRSARILARRACSTRRRTRRSGCRSTTAINWSSLRQNMPAISVRDIR
jgi:hypothetical protein